jgi:hypothetical protein
MTLKDADSITPHVDQFPNLNKLFTIYPKTLSMWQKPQ